MSRKKKKKRSLLNLIISFILLLVSGYLIYSLYNLDMLSLLFFLIITAVIILVDIFIIWVINRKRRSFIRTFFALVAVILIAGYSYGIYNLNNTADFIKKVVENAGIKEEVFSIYVLENSKYKKLTDLDGHDMGIYSKGSDLLDDAIKELNKKVTPNSETKYDDIEEILNAGINREVEAIFVSKSMKEIMDENYPSLISQYRILDEIVVTKKEKVSKSKVNVAKEPFTIYISGIDTSGSINTTGRSDVNILAVVNPKDGKILMIHTPRDYYVKLHSKNDYDKLTHAGIYGIDESLKTMEDIYARDIDFYFKINFSSVVKLVDSLGGIEVDVPKSFCEQDSQRRQGSYRICLNSGTQTINGEEALALARHRHTLSNGDMGRGDNQVLIMKAIINKMASKEIITKYSSILKVLDNYLVTNMDEKSISRLAKLQQEKNIDWQMESANVVGTNGYRTTYSGGRYKLAVVVPDDSSITKAKQKISEYLGEKQESSESKSN